jgi:hypothetical protein
MIENVFNKLRIPEYFHNPVIIVLWIVVIAIISWFVKNQISKTHLGNDVHYKAKKAITFGTYAVILLVVVIIYSSQLLLKLLHYLRFQLTL